MIGEWIRFGLCAAFLLAGLFIMVVSIIGLYRFDFALQRIHAAALGDTLSLLLFTIGILIAVGFHGVEAGAGAGAAMADLSAEQPHAQHV